ncbi:MAG TPA: M23 family metallopeptidase [Anaerolineales bacterium]|nr:M23 family metallopeptidase [Anaerolineales bacterium]
MNRLKNILIFLIILQSCVPIQTPQSLPTIAPTVFEPIPTSTSTPIPVFLFSTMTPVACDPFAVDFCITDGHFILQRPVKPPANDSVDSTYPYGSTANGTREPHHGVEFVNGSGTPVYAAADGMVIFAGPDEEAIYSPWQNYYGNLVVIKHNDGLFTLYAHLSKIDVQAGQEVLAADKIGEVGRTGAAIGSHLHFEVRRRDVQDYSATQNPELWLAPNKDGRGKLLGALMISIVDQGFDFQYAEFTIDYHLDLNGPRVKSYYVTTYTRDMMTGDENAALGDLPSGDYRIALKYNGQLYERWVEVESGKLTQVVIAVK